MTQPGSIIAPQPGWWVRTEHIGVTSGQYGWTTGDILGPEIEPQIEPQQPPHQINVAVNRADTY